MTNLIMPYPQPTEAEKFEADFAERLKLLLENTRVPQGQNPYTLTKFLPGPGGRLSFYQMFKMSFDPTEALQAAVACPGMQEVASGANWVSSRWAPLLINWLAQLIKI